ncbi:hypothetical protein L9F63_017634, partial [Diploptera punctata]
EMRPRLRTVSGMVKMLTVYPIKCELIEVCWDDCLRKGYSVSCEMIHNSRRAATHVLKKARRAATQLDPWDCEQ